MGLSYFSIEIKASFKPWLLLEREKMSLQRSILVFMLIIRYISLTYQKSINLENAAKHVLPSNWIGKIWVYKINMYLFQKYWKENHSHFSFCVFILTLCTCLKTYLNQVSQRFYKFTVWWNIFKELIDPVLIANTNLYNNFSSFLFITSYLYFITFSVLPVLENRFEKCILR